MLELRAHHINCLFFFRGMGYSEEFVDRMRNIKEQFVNSPKTKFRLVCKCDNICDSCPNLISYNTCESNDRVIALDRKTIDTYGLKENEAYDFEFIKENIYKKFNAIEFEKICGDCEWYKKGVCSMKIIGNQTAVWSI